MSVTIIDIVLLRITGDNTSCPAPTKAAVVGKITASPEDNYILRMCWCMWLHGLYKSDSELEVRE